MRRIHLVGFGSQGMAWAGALREAGWEVRVFLHQKGKGFEAARSMGLDPQLLTPAGALLRDRPRMVALLVPDAQIGNVYDEHLRPSEEPLGLILGHGYAVYAQELKPKAPMHQSALFAPKAIGPQVTKKVEEARASGGAHDLVAAVHFPERDRAWLMEFARTLRFADENLVDVTFEQEAVGDLISEQGLLCGGMFTLLEWTLEAMAHAKLPPKLLRAECLTELGLIVDQMIARGPSACFQKISQAAQCGATQTKTWLEASGAKAAFQKQVETIVQGGFGDQIRSPEWRSTRDAWVRRMQELEKSL